MASIRKIKKDIAFLSGEIISNSYLALYFQGEEATEALSQVISKAIELHNRIITAVNSNPEKNNAKLTRKYYAALEKDMFDSTDALFLEISAICQK